MFTDGQTTAGSNPSPIAAAARAAGVVIYAIGLSGSDGVDVSALEDWASKPSSACVAITPDVVCHGIRVHSACIANLIYLDKPKK